MSGTPNALRLYLSVAAAAVAFGVAAPVSHAATVDVTLQQIDRTAINGGLGTVDLTQGGAALDWLKPIGANLSAAQKASTSLLTLATQGAAFTPGTYGDDGYAFSWSGGEAGNPSGTSFQGSNNTGAGQNVGFRVTFTAPAAGDYRVNWYSAGNNTQNWRLTGTAGAATDFQQAGTNVGTTSGSGGVDEFFWTTNFTADSAGQVLTLDLLNSSGTNSAIAITGVTVAAVPEPSSALVLAGVLAAPLLRRRRRTAR